MATRRFDPSLERLRCCPQSMRRGMPWDQAGSWVSTAFREARIELDPLGDADEVCGVAT